MRIDVHAHIIPDFYLAALGEAGISTSGSVPYPAWSPALAIGLMDRHGIQAMVTSISSPGVHFGNDDKARDLARRCNEFSTGMIADHSARLGNFAVLPLPDVEGACREAAYALDVLKLDGIILLASYGEFFLGDPTYDPLMEVLNARKAVVFVHPNVHPSTKTLRFDLPAFLVEFTFDTTRAAVNLIASGATRRYPDIRFILAHAGGTLPYLAWRLSVGRLIDARLDAKLPDDVLGAVRHFWFDTALSAGPQSIGTLREVADPDKILFGSDWPFAPEPVTATSVAALTAPGNLRPGEREAIERSNALRLFPRFA
jgi:predicted TIM-barrel fold metal-dependent hydrolase